MDDQTDLESQVLKLVLTWAPGPIRRRTRDARLVEDLGYDSMTLIELAVVLEHELGLKRLAEAQVLVTETVDDVVAAVADAGRAA